MWNSLLPATFLSNLFCVPDSVTDLLAIENLSDEHFVRFTHDPHTTCRLRIAPPMEEPNSSNIEGLVDKFHAGLDHIVEEFCTNWRKIIEYVQEELRAGWVQDENHIVGPLLEISSSYITLFHLL